MWFKNLQIYRLPARWAMTAEQLAGFLAPQAFTPCTSLDLQSQGWVPPRPSGQLVHVVNQQMLLTLATEKKLLPSSVINQVAKARAAEVEEQQGFRPGRKQMKEIKEQAADDLLPRAFSIKSSARVWIDPVNGWLVIDSASTSKAEDVIRLLLKAVERFPLDTLRVAQSPVSAMTECLLADEAPGGFTVDQDTELRATGEGKATVRYVRHTLEAADVRRHIEGGKQCTRLAMTWADRVSFVLTESLTVKRLAPLDVLKETDGTSANDDERFDSDFALMTGELSRMLADLVAALGGEMNEQTDWVQRSAQTPAISERSASVDQDPFYDQAVQIVLKQQRASISLVQRHMRIGYNRAARLIEEMQRMGIVSPMASDGTRSILKPAA